MSDAWIAALSALLTGLMSLIGVYIANRKSATLIEYQIKELKEQVAKHNGFGDRITTIETKLTRIEKDLDEVKKKVEVL